MERHPPRTVRATADVGMPCASTSSTEPTGSSPAPFADAPPTAPSPTDAWLAEELAALENEDDPAAAYEAEVAALAGVWADPATERDWHDRLDALIAEARTLAAAETAHRVRMRRRRLAEAPGARTAAAVADALADADTDDELVSGFAASHRATSWLWWQQLGLAARLLTRWQRAAEPAQQNPSRARVHRGRDVDAEALAEASVICELALAAGMSEYAAGAVLDAAKALIVEGRLPATAALLEQGLLDRSRVQALVSRTRALTVEGARAVEARVYATRRVLELGLGKFVATVDRAVLVVDADAAERRRRQTRADRRVTFQALPDGAAELSAIGPADALAAAYAGLDAAARALRGAGDRRTLDQLHHDLLVTGTTSGHLPVPAHDLPVPSGTVAVPRNCTSAATDDGPNIGAAAGDPDAPSWFATHWPDVQPQIRVTVSLQTLLGLADDPADLDGYGPVAADLARDLASRGIWRCLAVDDTHGTVLGVGTTTWTAGYAPGKRLRTFLAHASPTCAVPRCGAASWRCDLDHARPYHRGGPTCACNVRPLCRRHHRLKTAGLLLITRSGPGTGTGSDADDGDDPPGTWTYTTRTGRAYVALPHSPLPPDCAVQRGSKPTQDGEPTRDGNLTPENERPRGRARSLPAAAEGRVRSVAAAAAVLHDPPPF